MTTTPTASGNCVHNNPLGSPCRQCYNDSPSGYGTVVRQVASLPSAPIASVSAEAWLRAARINDSDDLMKVYAAPEWDELSDDGKAWVSALVATAYNEGLSTHRATDPRIAAAEVLVEALRRIADRETDCDIDRSSDPSCHSVATKALARYRDAVGSLSS